MVIHINEQIMINQWMYILFMGTLFSDKPIFALSELITEMI